MPLIDFLEEIDNIDDVKFPYLATVRGRKRMATSR